MAGLEDLVNASENGKEDAFSRTDCMVERADSLVKEIQYLKRLITRGPQGKGEERDLLVKVVCVCT